MPTVLTWSKVGPSTKSYPEGKPLPANMYWREAKTSPTGGLFKVYYLGPKDNNGKRRQLTKTFDHETEAKRFLDEVTVKKTTGTLTDSKVGKRHLRELYEEVHQVRKYAPETSALHGYVWNALSPLHDVPIEDIDGPTVSKVLSRIDAPHMRQKARSVLSTLFNYAMTEWGWKANPATAPRRKKTRAERLEEGSNGEDGKRYLEPSEVERLLSELPDRYRVLVGLMASMGLRPGEAYALTVGKFDPKARTLVIDTSVSGFTKTGEKRTLGPRYIRPEIANILSDHIDRFSDPKDPQALIFPTPDGAMIHDGNFRNRVFYPARDRVGIEGNLTPNSCRHTAASFAFDRGESVVYVQRMLGHANPAITLKVYSHLLNELEEKRAAHLDEGFQNQWAPALRVMGAVPTGALEPVS